MNIKNQINIFIVDDNKIFAMTLKAYIENSFGNMLLKIHSFETGEECMKRFMQVMPDLVILDYFLNIKSSSSADGLQVLREIKKCSFETSVIMLTSNDQIDTALESFHLGASDYVVKTENQFKKIIQSISKIFTVKEMSFKNIENERLVVEQFIANKELIFQNEEKEKRIIERKLANKELYVLNIEKEKRALELININKELTFHSEESEKRASELIIANIQRSEVEKSKLVVEEKNKDITDSINYAKRIQLAKLPRKEEIYASFPNSFVLFKPKDIVSGDFYFFHKNEHSFFIAAADCTGHGVPGAFMSMIGSGKLDEAVARTSDTSDILKYLNKGVKKSLHQSDSDESTRDGMDIAICSVDTKKRIVKYAGANRPIWIIRNGLTIVDEIKGTKKAIGGLTDDNQIFESHELILQEGDTFYITTDGYADQFGGTKGKKLMTKKFKEILLSIQNLTMKEQKKHLNNYIEHWKAETEQVDDILVIGVRL